MPSFNETLQLLAWLVALLQFVLGLYVLVLNPWQTTNRYLFAFLALLGLNSIANGALFAAEDALQASLPSIILAITTPAIPPALVITAFLLLRPNMVRPGRFWIIWFFVGLVYLPLVLTVIDLIFETGLFFTGLDPETYRGGYVLLKSYTNGLFYDIVYVLNFSLSSLAAMIGLLYISIFDKNAPKITKRLAWLLLLAPVFGAASNLAQGKMLASTMTIATHVFYLLGFAFIAFLQMALDWRTQRGRLQTRLTWLTLAIALPLMAGLAIFLTNRAQRQLEVVADQNLSNLNHSLSSTVTLWLDANQRALHNMTLLPDIVSMNPRWHEPILRSMTKTYPHLYLVSTIDLDGVEISRSDELPVMDYVNTTWFQKVVAGSPVAIEALISRDLWIPDLILAMPIKDRSGELVGVGMFSTSLREISYQLHGTSLGRQGVAFLVDENNQLLVHSSWADGENRSQYALHDMSDHPAISQFDQIPGDEGQGKVWGLRLIEEDGKPWRGSVNKLNNEWGIVVEQPESVLLSPLRSLQRISWVMLLIGGALLFILMWITIRQGFQPIRLFTESAAAIAGGDLKQRVYIESQDEFGTLAKSFNSMTAQLRELVGGLEDRVAERTQSLQQRAVQLQVAAEVGSEAAAIQDPHELMQHVVQLISDRFDFYHAGIFLVQRFGSGVEEDYAVLQAASSEGGRRMLGRDHKLKVGKVGIVGHVAGTGEPRIALDVGEDAVFFNNPDLPLTHSEMALPLKVHGRVIGVLDVQSTKPSAFSEEDLTVLQILADQIAVAFENTRLLRESESAYQELQSVYGAQISQKWKDRLAGKALVYSFDRSGVRPLKSGNGGSHPSDIQAHEPDERTVSLPIELRGQRMGSLVLKRGGEMKSWTDEERDLIQGAVSQLALAIENARLLEEIQQRASQEETINQVVAKLQNTLDFDAVMRTAVKEIGRAIRVDKVQIRLAAREDETDFAVDPNGHQTGSTSGDGT